MKCSSCKFEETARKVNYGELTSLGGEIKVNDCLNEIYDEDGDNCVCGNYEIKGEC